MISTLEIQQHFNFVPHRNVVAEGGFWASLLFVRLYACLVNDVHFLQIMNLFFHFYFQLSGGQYYGINNAHLVPCPPAFPDFEAIFANTLRYRPEFRAKLEELKWQYYQPPNCTYSPTVMQNLGFINYQRCTTNSYLELECFYTTPEPTTTTTEATTTSTQEPTTTIKTTQQRTTTEDKGIIGGRRTTTPWWTWTPSSTERGDRGSTWRRPPSTAAPALPPVQQESPTPRWGGGQAGGDHSASTAQPEDQDTEGVIIPGPGVTGVIPTVAAVVHKKDNFTTIIISIGAGILGLMLIIGLIFFCR